MGLLDDVLGHLQQNPATAPAGGASHADILGAITQMLGHQGGVGGLNGLIQLFGQAGLGHIVQSWVGSGQNLPISPAQLQQVLGPGVLQGLAGKLNLSPDVLTQQLSHSLPMVVDKLTPQGQVPAQDPLAALGGLLGGGGAGGAADALGMLKKLL
ncbi:MAG: YidB family protein [Gemmatimonadales bacterium]